MNKDPKNVLKKNCFLSKHNNLANLLLTLHIWFIFKIFLTKWLWTLGVFFNCGIHLFKITTFQNFVFTHFFPHLFKIWSITLSNGWSKAKDVVLLEKLQILWLVIKRKYRINTPSSGHFRLLQYSLVIVLKVVLIFIVFFCN